MWSFQDLELKVRQYKPLYELSNIQISAITLEELRIVVPLMPRVSAGPYCV